MAAKDDFENIAVGETFPANRAVAITASDSDELDNVTRAIYVGSTGDLKVVTLGGDTIVFKSLPAGALLPVRAKQVLSTGTTASDLVALW